MSNSGSGSECCNASSSGTISGECQTPSSSSQSPGIICPQPVVVTTSISSSSDVLFNRPFQLPSSARNSTNYGMVISLPSPLGLPATTTSSSSSSFAANNSRTTSRIAPTRRASGGNGNSGNSGNNGGSPGKPTESSSTATSILTPAPSSTTTDAKSGGGQGKSTTKSTDDGTSPGHVSSETTATDTLIIYAPTATITSFFDTTSAQDATTILTMNGILTTVNAMPITAIVSGTLFTVSPTATKQTQELVSYTALTTITSEWTSGGHTFMTTMTLGSNEPGSVYPSPTGTATSATSTSTTNHLPMILGIVLGVALLVALGAIFHKYSRRRQRAESLPQLPLPVHDKHQDCERWLLRVPAPLVTTPATLGIPAPPPRVERISVSQADNSSQISELSNPFADNSFRASSRTTAPAPSIYSVETVSTQMQFMSDMESTLIESSTLHTTDISELNFLDPIPSVDRTSTYSTYVSPTGHYRQRPPRPDTRRENRTGSSLMGVSPASTHSRALSDEARRN